MDTIQIKQLGAEDWRDYKAIRLKALRDCRSVFSSNYEKEAAYEDHFWQDRLKDQSCAVFGLYDGSFIVGLTGIFTRADDQSGKTGQLGMSFIDAAYRGQGLSRLLYEVRINWAREQGRFDVILVSHRVDNEASRRANQAFGFKYIGKELTDWPDGTKAYEYNYELRL